MTITFYTPPGGPKKIILNTGTEENPVIVEYGPNDFEEYSILYPDRASRDFSTFEEVKTIQF